MKEPFRKASANCGCSERALGREGGALLPEPIEIGEGEYSEHRPTPQGARAVNLSTGSKPARYAVIGHPIEHSQSPWLHRRFAAQLGEAIEYTRICAPLEGFTACVRQFFAEGGCGLNITLPFKLKAYALANTLSPRAAAAGAVNTLRADADGLYGDNTDGIGLVRDVERNLNVAIAQRRILLLGAGGAARGILPALIKARPAELTIVNRTVIRAAELVCRFAPFAEGLACKLTGGGLEAAHGAFDIVINATSASLNTTQPCGVVGSAITENTLAYDLMYGIQPSIFMQTARQCGACVSDGLGMLVEQAAESFFVWRGVRPNSAPILAELRARMPRIC